MAISGLEREDAAVGQYLTDGHRLFQVAGVDKDRKTVLLDDCGKPLGDGFHGEWWTVRELVDQMRLVRRK